MGESFDLVVVGSGPAGEKGAAVAAYHGKRVALVERSPSVGGTTVHTGGIPTKSLRETALQLSGARRADGLTVELDLAALFERLRARAGAVSATMQEVVAANLVHHGIEVVHGSARLSADGSVVVAHAGRDGTTLLGEVVLLAPGSRPVWPAWIPFDGTTVVDTDEILALDEPFASIVIVGAGAVGCEYASIFAAIGIDVALVDVAELLPVGIYTVPEVAAVGMTEEAAVAAGIDHEVGRAWFDRNTRALVAGDSVGLLKHPPRGRHQRAGANDVQRADLR